MWLLCLLVCAVKCCLHTPVPFFQFPHFCLKFSKVLFLSLHNTVQLFNAVSMLLLKVLLAIKHLSVQTRNMKQSPGCGADNTEDSDNSGSQFGIKWLKSSNTWQNEKGFPSLPFPEEGAALHQFQTTPHPESEICKVLIPSLTAQIFMVQVF